MVNLRDLSRFVTERRCATAVFLAFLALAAAIALTPYDPSADLADATTNLIWVEQCSNGVHHIPYDEWDYGITQSVVVEYRGEYVVVNEKGPGHVFMMLPFYMAGIDWVFPILMMGLALLGTYMLGKRLFGWQAGFIASLLVLSNLVVIVMWHRYYWTDASTMHLLVLAFWLLVEGNYRYNGRSLDPRGPGTASLRDRLLGVGLCMLSGLAFGASVSTRYPTGLLAVVFALYISAFYLVSAWPSLKTKRIKKAFADSTPFLILLGAFALGLLMVLVPLTQYNSTYFGGPFNSGYDATSLIDFNRTGTLDVRNTTAVWTDNIISYLSTALGNLGILLPTFIIRMPALIFLPLGAYFLRKSKLELAVLLLWIGINFYTYLSLEWVTMYARNPTPWEPRYWLPSLPAVSILGAVGIHRLATWFAGKKAREYRWPDQDMRAAKVLISGALVGVLVLWPGISAIGYLQNPEVQEGTQPPPGQQATIVTTDLLLANPSSYVGKAVLLLDSEVIGRSFSMMDIRSADSVGLGVVAVKFADYPPGTLPTFQVGQHVEVRGMLIKANTPPDAPPIYYLAVKYGTADYARLLQ